MNSENPKKTCQCCLSNTHLDFELQHKLLEAYKNITLIEDEDEILDNIICSECYTQLEAVVNFSEMCKKSYEHLKKESKPEMLEIKVEIDGMVENPLSDDDFDNDPLTALSSKTKGVREIQEPTSRVRKCVTCHKDFPNPASLRKHYADSEECSSKSHKCSFCGKIFSVNYLLTEHVNAMHLDITPFSCDQCSLTFKWKSNFRRHLKTHSKNYKYRDCHLCPKRFKLPSALKAHVNSVHLGITPYVCEQCGKAFKRNQNLGIHILRHKIHNETATGEETTNSANSFSLNKKESNPKIHPGMLETHPELKQLTCKECGNFYSSKASLTEHMLTHTGERNFLCSECGKSFISKSSLKHHSMVHSSEKPYICTTCPAAFKKKSSLTAHKDMHLGIKPFSCDICGKSFRQQSHLKYHKKMHLGIKPHKCNVCDKRFTSTSNMKIHKRSHTGEPEGHFA